MQLGDRHGDQHVAVVGVDGVSAVKFGPALLDEFAAAVRLRVKHLHEGALPPEERNVGVGSGQVSELADDPVDLPEKVAPRQARNVGEACHADEPAEQSQVLRVGARLGERPAPGQERRHRLELGVAACDPRHAVDILYRALGEFRWPFDACQVTEQLDRILAPADAVEQRRERGDALGFDDAADEPVGAQIDGLVVFRRAA